jgi:hypothetical protein
MMFPAERAEEVVALLSLMLMAFLMACLSWFLNHLLDDHPIGKSYLLWLQSLPENLAKPLGECVYCSGAWQFLFVTFFIFKYPLFLCLIGLGLNHLFLKQVGLMLPK